MADTLSESGACALLARLFRQRGYAIERDVPFAEKRPAKRAAAGKPSAARGAKPGGKRPIATKGRPVGTGATRQRAAEQPAGGLRVRGTRAADARGRRGAR